jgi:hypothetical protein
VTAAPAGAHFHYLECQSGHFCCIANRRLLLCKQVCCDWYLVYLNWPEITKRNRSALQEKGTQMSKTASIGLVPSTSLFARVMATIDRLLMASARISNRNGDLPRFGL